MNKQNLNLEDIKVGEMYNVRVKVTEKEHDKIITRTVYDDGSALIESPTIFFSKEVLAFSLVNPYPAPIEFFLTTVIPEAAPKYDPCRLLRKGDKVQVKKRDGRCNGKAGEYLREAFCTVAEDETQNELVRVLHNATEYRLDPAYLELVTPVEEQEPYEVECDDDDKEYSVTIRNKFVCTYPYDSDSFYTKEQAKAAAEAECARLNAEDRKEQNDG